MKLTIINYNAGNVQSVRFALQRLGIDAELSNDPEVLASSDKIIFPGVGEASTAMRYLQTHKLDQLICNLKQPILGICLGMQLLCKFSEENNTNCLGIFDQKVLRFESPKDQKLKVPQIGWNTISNLNHPLFSGVQENEYVYFVHSYYAEKSEHTIAETDYCLPYSAALQKDNYYAVQFHPEKSSRVGERILQNFLDLSI